MHMHMYVHIDRVNPKPPLLRPFATNTRASSLWATPARFSYMHGFSTTSMC